MPVRASRTGGIVPRVPEVNTFERRRWNDESWAGSWPEREVITATVTPALMAALEPRPSERIVDLGAGAGCATLEIARRVAPGGVVLGVDLSGALTDLARRRAEQAGLSNVSFVVADAQTDPFPGAPFDAATSQFGVMFFDDPVAAFANIAAQLRPRGRFAFACWQAAARNVWNTGQALRPFAPPPIVPPSGANPPGPFSLGDPEETASLLAAAGFVDADHREVTEQLRTGSSALYHPSQLELSGVPADRRAEAEAAVAAHLARLEVGEDAYEFTIAYAIWTARAA